MKNKCLLSILIPTLESRKSMCERLCRELDAQVGRANADEAVEILTLRDDGSAAVGAKRNRLIDMARGRFIVFVDDDDSVSETYVEQIIGVLREHPETDCVSFVAEISFRNRHRTRLVHSIRHRDWYYHRGEYLRPPCHITPLRRAIAVRYPFAEVDYAEDMDWTLRINHDKALKKEVILDEVLYFYDCRRHYALQWLLDRSQALRHALGLRFTGGLIRRREPDTSRKGAGKGR